jgi:GNAT superfamily N-acetyltransferase
MRVAVRPAAEAELPALVENLEQRLYFIDRLARQRLGRGALLVAWLDGAPVGDVYLRLEGPDEDDLDDLRDVPLLTHLEVLPAHRKRGIGSLLMARAEAIAWRQGYDRVALGVTEDNTDAIRLYLRRGYTLWRPDPIETYREVFREDGTVHAVPDEPCLVYVRRRPADLSR